MAVAAIGVSALALNTHTASDVAPPAPKVSVSSAAPTPKPTPKPTPTALKIKLPKDPSVLIIGDSYTEGVGTADALQEGWAYVASRTLDLNPRVDGIAGTGFAWGGGPENTEGRQFSVRLREIADEKTITPDVLVIQGGQSDTLLKDDAAVTKAVVSTVTEARKLWPGVQVVVMGPSAPEPLASNLAGTNAAVRAGAATAKVPFINATGEHWFTAQTSDAYHYDGSHVNTAGHKVIADRFAAHWRKLTK